MRPVMTVLLAAALLTCGCSKKKDDPAGDKSIAIQIGVTDSGDENVTAGECVSFRVTGENTTFTPGNVSVDISYNDGEESVIVATTHMLVVNETLLLVGEPDGNPVIRPCWCLGPGTHAACEAVPLGSVDVSVRDDTDILTVEDVFTLTATVPAPLTLGTATSADLNRQGDNDYYTVTVDNTVLAITTVPTGFDTWLPQTYGYSEDYEAVLAIGGRAAIRDLTSAAISFEYKPAVSGYLLQGGESGYEYDVKVTEYSTVVDYATADVSSVNRWDDGTLTAENPNLLELSEGVYAGAVGESLTAGPATNNYNPNPDSLPNDVSTWGTGCVSQDDQLNDPAASAHFPILGRGRDIVYKYVAPADGDVLMAIQSEGEGTTGSGDYTLYIVEDPANDLPDGSSGTCLAATDLFSDRTTDSVIFAAVSGTTYYVFIDLYQDVSGDRFTLLVDEL